MKHSGNKKFIAACLACSAAFTSLPFLPASAAKAPVLDIQDTRIAATDVGADGKVAVNVLISDNKGVCASSFGIEYSDSLVYADFTAGNSAGQTFNVVCKPEDHRLWFISASGSKEASANVLQQEILVTLYFTLEEGITGGDFPLNFTWNSLDGSSAYWYTDKSRDANVISEVQETASAGILTVFNPDDEHLNYTSVRMNQETQEQLTVYNASGNVIWFSSNPAVASVDANGLVQAVSPGTCSVQAYINNKILNCDVEVTEYYYYNIAGQDELILKDINKTFVLEYPAEKERTWISASEVAWISATPDIASIDKNGIIQPKQNGIAYLMGTYNGISYMKPVTVQIEDVKPIEEIMPGDVNGDSSVDIMDVILLNKAIFGKAELTDEQLKAADLNGNNVPDSTDALSIMKRIIKLEG